MRWWDEGRGWKNVLNNLRLMIQPFIYLCLTSPWLGVFDVNGLRGGFLTLITFMNGYRGFYPLGVGSTIEALLEGHMLG